MTVGVRLSPEEAESRFDARGITLLGTYRNNREKVSVRCREHGADFDVIPNNIFKGQRLSCCGNVGRSQKHTGKIVTFETRKKLSEHFSGANHPQFGIPLSESTGRKVSRAMKAKYASSVDYPAMKAACGKTAGRVGTFYIARLGNGLLKFGSVAKMKPWQRMAEFRQRYGDSSRFVLLARVPDAGAYEAEMMRRHGQHWVRGEYFRDFLSGNEVRLAA